MAVVSESALHPAYLGSIRLLRHNQFLIFLLDAQHDWKGGVGGERGHKFAGFVLG